jgi:hypothetical protein
MSINPVAKLVEMLITQKTNGQPPRFSPDVAGKRKAATAVQTEGMENG